MDTTRFQGFDIHMSGNSANRPLTVLSYVKNTTTLMAYTMWRDGSFRKQLTLGTDEDISVSLSSGNCYVVIINNKAFKTAMLLNRFGDGNVACFTSELSYTTLVNTKRLTRVNEVITSHTLSELKDLVSLEIHNAILLSIQNAFIQMDKVDTYAKSKLGAEYANIIKPYLNLYNKNKLCVLYEFLNSTPADALDKVL